MNCTAYPRARHSDSGGTLTAESNQPSSTTSCSRLQGGTTRHSACWTGPGPGRSATTTPWIDSVLEAQRHGRGPPQHVDDADDDGDGDEYGDLPFMPDDDEYGQNLSEPTAEDTRGFESAPA